MDHWSASARHSNTKSLLFQSYHLSSLSLRGISRNTARSGYTYHRITLATTPPHSPPFPPRHQEIQDSPSLILLQIPLILQIRPRPHPPMMLIRIRLNHPRLPGRSQDLCVRFHNVDVLVLGSEHDVRDHGFLDVLGGEAARVHLAGHFEGCAGA